MGKCDGKVAFITGASRGIGKAIAKRLAAEGAAVVVNSPVMGEEKGLPGTLESAVEDIQAMGAKEPVEMMAEGALELCTGRHVGRVIASRDIVHYAARRVHSLDGRTVLGDAFLLGDPDSTAAE